MKIPPICSNPQCGSPADGKHHCFFPSEYDGEDRHDPWNLIYICQVCHTSIHKEGNIILNIYFKVLALRTRRVIDLATAKLRQIVRKTREKI